jgi:hypothetical protein
LYPYSRIVLMIAAVCIASGGLYDVFTPRLPSNLAARCSGNEAARVVIRELLRALGACLVAIGAAVATVATSMDLRHDRRAIALILTLVLPSEGLNALGMRRVGSPYVVPMLFILLTVAGAALGLLAPDTWPSY